MSFFLPVRLQAQLQSVLELMWRLVCPNTSAMSPCMKWLWRCWGGQTAGGGACALLTGERPWRCSDWYKLDGLRPQIFCGVSFHLWNGLYEIFLCLSCLYKLFWYLVSSPRALIPSPTIMKIIFLYRRFVEPVPLSVKVTVSFFPVWSILLSAFLTDLQTRTFAG